MSSRVSRTKPTACIRFAGGYAAPVAKGVAAGITRVNTRGEHVISVVKRLTPASDGSTTIEAQITLDQAPIPDRRYSADALYVNYDGDGEAVSLLFAQRSLGGPKLRSLVALKVYPDHVRKFLETTGVFSPQLETYLANTGAQVPDLTRLNEEPEHVVSLVSNLVAAGFSARESVMDFYHFNALSLRKLNTSSDLAIDPVVRIDLPTTLLAALVRTLSRLVSQLPPETI